ncbi:MAG: uridine diphosphate-N-acetylglucosamine-binding protein YvcK [Clostridiaceae bacterium]
MKINDWLRPGIKVKRWILLGLMGILFITFGVLEFVNRRFYSIYYISFYVFLIFSGLFVLYISAVQAMKSIIALINKGYLNVSLDSRKLGNLIYEKRLLVQGPKIVAIGGGTGLSTMLRGIKYYTSNITAIVTVGDDGGGSGDLRTDLGILPPGDIRNCILALADTEPIMEDLLQYRFTEGKLKNQSFGNLLLAAMDGISNNFEEAVQKVSDVLAVTGRVMPVTLDNMVLKARLKNGDVIEGESNIPQEVYKRGSAIDMMFIEPKNAAALKDALDAISEADAIILGPGSLYTSVIPNLLVKDITNSISKSDAIRIYVSNIMTQRGETDHFSVSDHVEALFKHTGGRIVDYAVANVGKIGDELAEKYMAEGAEIVRNNEETMKKLNVNVIEGDFVKVENGKIRHNSDRLASILVETIMEKKLLFDRKKIIEYFYLSEKLKQSKDERE